MKRNHSRAGFSLVELAIVLIIIGLIVGGVLQGQDLIRSARLNSVQTDLNKIRTAVGTFQDRFVALPGDLRRASLLNDDWADGPGKYGGDGNGRIGSPGSGTDWSTGENRLFWMHLAEAGMLSGVNAQMIQDESQLVLDEQGGSFESSLGGSFTINFADPGESVNNTGGLNETTMPAQTGHWILLAGGTETPFSPTNNTTEGIIAPVELRSIDIKADDGSPINGDVLGIDHKTDSGCVDTDDNSQYGTSDDTVCLAAFGL